MSVFFLNVIMLIGFASLATLAALWVSEPDL